MLVSAGNFHGQYVAKASDFIGMGLFNIGRFSESRIQRYINGRTSKLHDFLIKFGGLNSGFMISQCNSFLIQTLQHLYCQNPRFWSNQPLLIPFPLLPARKTMCRWADLQRERPKFCMKISLIFWEQSSCAHCSRLIYWN